MKEMKDEMKKVFAEEFEKIKTETNQNMEALQSTSVMLQRHVKNLKSPNEELQKECKENEQYSRRLCLRIKGLMKKKQKKMQMMY